VTAGVLLRPEADRPSDALAALRDALAALAPPAVAPLLDDDRQVAHVAWNLMDPGAPAAADRDTDLGVLEGVESLGAYWGSASPEVDGLVDDLGLAACAAPVASAVARLAGAGAGPHDVALLDQVLVARALAGLPPVRVAMTAGPEGVMCVDDWREPALRTEGGRCVLPTVPSERAASLLLAMAADGGVALPPVAGPGDRP
jgi:hypothetical protein